MAESRRYRVYLLRLWQTAGSDGQPVWRAALEDAQNGDRKGFADLEQLCAYIKTLSQPIDTPERGPSTTES